MNFSGDRQFFTLNWVTNPGWKRLWLHVCVHTFASRSLLQTFVSDWLALFRWRSYYRIGITAKLCTHHRMSVRVVDYFILRRFRRFSVKRDCLYWQEWWLWLWIAVNLIVLK
jgi:hypothetical protein